jgi:hypothetical protein
MATLTVPATIPSVEEDCEQLRKAFQGPRSTPRPGHHPCSHFAAKSLLLLLID